MVDVIRELESFAVKVDVVDPHASAAEVKEEYDYELSDAPNGPYDAVIVAVNHKEYVDLPESQFQEYMPDGGVFVDVKGIYRDKITQFDYWSL